MRGQGPMRRLVDLLIFDLDGTLVDSRLDLAASVNHALRRMGLAPLSVETVAGFVGDGVQALLTRALTAARGAADPAEVEAGLQVFREHYATHLLDATRAYPGVPEALQALGHKAMAIATNKPRTYALAILEGLGLHHQFRLVVGGDSTPHRKPHPAQAEAILSALGLSPASALVVGDSPQDVAMARAVGCGACAVTYGLRSREELAAAAPDFLLDDLRDLPPRIR